MPIVNMIPKYISGSEAFFDDEKSLYYCYIGITDRQKSLQFLAFGPTAEDAIMRAKQLCYILNALDRGLNKMAEKN